jgi:hypothetical protein
MVPAATSLLGDATASDLGDTWQDGALRHGRCHAERQLPLTRGGLRRPLTAEVAIRRRGPGAALVTDVACSMAQAGRSTVPTGVAVTGLPWDDR